MENIKIIIHIEAEPDTEIIGIKEDFAAYCEKFGDVRMIEVEEESQAMTNFDRIKAMSIDELAKFIPDWSYTKACKCDELPYAQCNYECDKCVKEWLESEVEPDE